MDTRDLEAAFAKIGRVSNIFRLILFFLEPERTLLNELELMLVTVVFTFRFKKLPSCTTLILVNRVALGL